MNMKKTLLSCILAVCLLMAASSAFAVSSANITYNETVLGGGSWQYDYIFYNMSTNNEYLYSVDLLFDQTATVTGLPLPSGWDSTIWEGENQTDFIFTFSASSSYDIAAGNSMSGFSFTTDYQAGDIGYNAYFDDHAGGITNTLGTTTMVPEPVSTSLFIIGAATLGFRRFRKKNTN